MNENSRFEDLIQIGTGKRQALVNDAIQEFTDKANLLSDEFLYRIIEFLKQCK